MVGLISNIAALSAQANLTQASADSQASIYRLSSGNAISKASDNVGGLAVGTILKTNVSTLKTALTNAAQANSMLGVADGALSAISDILQRQKALATQATSGSLTDTARGFLDQEFQNLKSEIDRISNSTNFNGIHLIDGSLYAPSTLTTKASESNSTVTSGTVSIATAATNGKTIGINGVTFNFKTAGTLTAAPTDIAITGTASTDVTNLNTAISNVLNSIDPTQAANKLALAGLTYSDNGTGVLTITSKQAGTVFAAAGAKVININNGFAATGDVLVNGATTTTGANTALSAGGTAGTNGDLPAGTFGTTTAYTGTATTIAQGSVNDSILKALTPLVQATTGVDVSNISNNAAFTGILQGFQATYLSGGESNVSIQIGDHTYTAKNVSNAPAAATFVRFTSIDANGGSFDIQIDTATNSGSVATTNQADANAFASRLNKAFSGVQFFQNRAVADYTAVGTVYPTGSTTSNGNLAGTSLTFINSQFTNMQAQSVTVTAPVLGASTATIQVVINGETYTSGFLKDGSATTAGALGSAGTGTSLSAAATMGLVSTTNPKNMLVFTNGSTALTLDTTAKAQGFQQALSNALGINSGASNLTFQVGTAVTDNIALQLQSSKTANIYLDSYGNSQVISVNSLANATFANPIIDTAINTITALRATVGALESRFNYASSNLTTAIQNQDAARGTFLDTDISSESTNFAQAQVRLQASISVLAQANQLPQSLLKLLG
jgi:flagellin